MGAEVRKKIPTATKGKVVKLRLADKDLPRDALVSRIDTAETMVLTLGKAGKYDDEAVPEEAPVYSAPEEWLKIPHGAMFVNGILLGNAGGLIREFMAERKGPTEVF